MEMPAEWNVEGALEEVADAIAEGSVKLILDETTRKKVKDLYRKDFEKHTEAEWRAARSTLLDMARTAGTCSETATIVLWVNGQGTVSKTLDHETVLLVCVIVSRLYCTLEKGPWCGNAKDESAKGQKLEEILKEIG